MKLVNVKENQYLRIKEDQRLESIWKYDERGGYIGAFKSKEDLISFVKEKIERKYRYYLKIFMKKQNSDKKREERSHKDEKHRNK